MIYIPSILVFASIFYFLKFSSKLPGDFLMLAVFICWFIFIFIGNKDKTLKDFFLFLKNKNKKTLIAILLFLSSATLSLFLNGFTVEKLGQWLVIYFLPVSVFFLCCFIFYKHPKAKDLLVSSSYFLVGTTGIFALLQYFTLLGLEPLYWGNEIEQKRATSFFSHPNFFGLFIAPILSLLIPFTFEALRNLTYQKNYLKFLAWVLGACGILLSFSRSSWLGVLAALGVYLVFSANKKTRLTILLVSLLFIFGANFVPALKNRALAPFKGEKSASSRLTLWESGIKGIKESPIFGLGLTGYSQNYKSLISDPGLENHNYPHNIFLSLWNENGILGLVSFLAILYFILISGLKNKNSLLPLGAALFVVCLLTQGIIDNPYFKNDLALLFWLIAALVI